MTAPRRIVALAALVGLACPASARAETPRPLRFNGLADVPITAVLASLYGVSELGVKARLAPRAPYWDDRDEHGADILAPLDRQAARLRWGRPGVAGHISDVGLGLAFGSALGVGMGVAAVDADTPAHLAENATIVLESLTAAMTINQVTKFFAGRQRPCAHFGLGEARPCSADGSDNNLSSFSGHATLTSSLAVASGMVASTRGYRLAPLVWTTGALITVSTGYLRIAGDKHYLSDVIAGTLVGSAVGFFVPYLFHAPYARSSEAPAATTAASLRAAPLFGFSGVW